MGDALVVVGRVTSHGGVKDAGSVNRPTKGGVHRKEL